MKILGERDQLLKGIQTVGNMVSEKSLLPILSNVVIETTPEGIQLLATDLKTSISHHMKINVLQQGAVTLPAKKLADIIRELPDGEIELMVEEGYKAKIFSGKTRYQISGFSKEDFPKLPAIQEGAQLLITTKVLKQLIQTTAFAAAQDDTRFVLNGCLITVSPEGVRFVATDGHRLSWSYAPIKSLITWQAIIPTKTLRELVNVLGDDETNVAIIHGDNKLEFSIHHTHIVASLVDGQFPNVEEVLKRPYAQKISLTTQAFSKAIKRVSLVALDKSNTITLQVKKNLMTLSAHTPELGDASDDLEIAYEGPEITILLNYRYILDALKVISGDRFTLGMNDAASAVCLIPQAVEEGTHIVMPIRST